MIPLPTIDAGPCDGCGLCCMTLGTPPGFYPAYAAPEFDGKSCTDAEDWAIWQAMPEELRQSLRDFYAEDANWSRCDSGEPCLWFDGAAKRCSQYAHRPEACRAFRPGEPACNRMRKEAGLPLLPPVTSAEEEGEEP